MSDPSLSAPPPGDPKTPLTPHGEGSHPTKSPPAPLSENPQGGLPTPSTPPKEPATPLGEPLHPSQDNPGSPPPPKRANTQDQDLLTLGSCGGAEAEIVLGDLELLSISDATHRKIVSTFRDLVTTGTARWSHLYTAQRLRLELLPLPRLRGELAELRATFQLIAGKTLREKYRLAAEDFARDRQKAEQQNDLAAEEKFTRAEAIFLLTQNQFIETYRPHQERKRLTIARGILTSALILIGAYVVLGIGYALVVNGGAYPNVLILVASFGALGAALSSIIRLQDSFREGRMILNSTRYLRKHRDFYPTLISGSIFAVLLTLIIVSGLGETLLKGNLPPGGISVDLGAFFWNAMTSDGKKLNLAILLVWAFAAGFAERLVPDTLDRLVGARSNEAREQKT